jgi:mRNA-degrading endonuclease YafQ of YafQ-DinJ toxin-antitoxin module
MPKISWDSGFKRVYKRKVKGSPQLKEEFWEVMALFEKEPFHPELKTHKLTGKLKGLWAFSVNYIFFRKVFKQNSELLLTRSSLK